MPKAWKAEMYARIAMYLKGGGTDGLAQDKGRETDGWFQDKDQVIAREYIVQDGEL
jgi:hypothetical protein